MRKLFEWIPATGKIEDRLCRYKWPEDTEWSYQVTDAFNKGHLYLGKEIEYLGEVDLKWPSEMEINKKIAEVPFMPYLEHHLSLSSRLNAYEKGFTAAIQWLQQQLKK